MHRAGLASTRRRPVNSALNDSFPESSTAATGRQHSATNGCFREVKNQRPLFGDELEEMSVAFRPSAASQGLYPNVSNAADTCRTGMLHTNLSQR